MSAAASRRLLIGRLGGLKARRDLAATSHDLAATSPRSRHDLAATLPLRCVQVLNGGEVKPRSRDDAERFYLRQLHSELPEGGLPPALVASLPSDETKASCPPPPLPSPLAPRRHRPLDCCR